MSLASLSQSKHGQEIGDSFLLSNSTIKDSWGLPFPKTTSEDDHPHDREATPEVATGVLAESAALKHRGRGLVG